MAFFKPRTKELTMTWGKRLILVVLILIGLIYGVMSLAERNKEAMRQGLEDYLVKATGHPSEITDMPTVKMTPNVIFRMNGINIRDASDKDIVLAHADKVYFATPLWKLFLGQKDYIGFEVQGLEIAGGFYLPEKITADFLGISDPAPSKEKPPVFMMDGLYNNQPVLITADMHREITKKHYLYSFDSNFRFTFKLGSTEADGVFSRGLNSVNFKQVQLVRGDDRAEFVIRNFKGDTMSATIEGTINEAPFNATLKKSDENVLLTVVPADPKDSGKILTFIDKLKKDMALTHGDKDKFQIVLEDAIKIFPATQTQETEITK